jgi:pSer/pThr/pTyr-binding forkhead associated (FHA) protein
MNTTKLSDSGYSEHDILKVRIEKGNSKKKEYYFKDSFSVGRSDECQIQIDEGVVSRIHLEVINEQGKWLLLDKYSSNGTFFNGSRVDRIEIKSATTVVLGNNGPMLLFTFEKPDVSDVMTDQAQDDPSVTKYIRRYFEEAKDEQPVGQHTKLMREAFKVVKKKQTSKYLKIIIAIAVLAVLFGAYSIYQHVKENEQKQLAETVFYDMKALDLEIEALKENLANTSDPSVKKALEKFDERRRQLEKNYEKLVDDLGVYNLNEIDKLIVKTARVFGECEFAIPQGFIDEVKSYIKKWQSTDRYKKALERAEQNGYKQLIVNYFIRNRLPHQFFYLAMQESDFIEQRVGPQTRYGYAKGIWQFIPETGKRYGLTIGQYSDQNIYDAGDDRFNLPKSTSAAARYIKDIYNTDAQASGLLVMASYNWGEHRIINLIRTMPENPRERNFWKLLEKYREKMPDETYNYVFYIFSAAVIGENPRLFGFNFDNPLHEIVQSSVN